MHICKITLKYIYISISSRMKTLTNRIDQLHEKLQYWSTSTTRRLVKLEVNGKEPAFSQRVPIKSVPMADHGTILYQTNRYKQTKRDSVVTSSLSKRNHCLWLTMRSHKTCSRVLQNTVQSTLKQDILNNRIQICKVFHVKEFVCDC